MDENSEHASRSRKYQAINYATNHGAYLFVADTRDRFKLQTFEDALNKAYEFLVTKEVIDEGEEYGLPF